MKSSQQELSQYLLEIEKENGVLFALKWLAFGVFLALCSLLTGCDSFLPKDTPRYNTVIGERRVPAMNQPLIAQSDAGKMADAGAASPVPMAPPMASMPMNPPETPPAPTVIQAPQAMPEYQTSQPAMPAQPPAPMPMQPQPSMMDQMSGDFSSQPMAPSEFPQLPATPAPVSPAAAQMQQQASADSAAQLEAEMADLERELQSSQQQQATLNQMPSEEPIGLIPDDQPAAQESAPLPWNAAPTPQDQMPWQSAAYEAPAAPRAPVQQQQPIDYTQQPLPEAAYAPAPAAAPVISEQAAMDHYAQQSADPMMQAQAPAYTAPMDVPAAPDVQATPFSRLPSGLIPPEMASEYEQGYLPPSRYRGRY